MNFKIAYKKIAWSTIVQYIGKIIQLLIAIIITKKLTNFFPNDIYGKYAWIVEYCLFFAVATNLGLFANSIRLISDSPLDGKLFSNILILRVITASLFFIPAIIISSFISSWNLLILAYILFSISLIIDFVTMICDAYLQANYLMGRATFALIMGKILHFFLVFAAIRYYTSIPTIKTIPLFMIFSLAGSLVTAGLSLFFISQKLKFEFKFDKKLSIHILKTGLPFGIINILNYLYFRFIPIALAEYFLTDSQFSTFDISFRIAFVLSLFSTFLMFSVMPVFKRSLTGKEWRFSFKLFKAAFFILTGAGIFLVCFGTWLGPFIIESLTNRTFILPEFRFIFPLFLFLSAVSYFYDLVLIILFSTEHDIWLLKREIISLISAGMLFGLAFFISNIQLKIIIVILGAITGEIIIVSLGMIKIFTYLKDKLKASS